jgi:predicted RNase H-like HicB family nuclease
MMMTRHYIAIAEQVPGEEMWSILFPDFPGVTSAAADFADVPQQARDALATAVEDMIAKGEKLPASAEEGGRGEIDGPPRGNARVLIVPVEIRDASTGKPATSTAAS